MLAVVAAAGLAICLLVLVAVQPAEAAFPGTNGKIAFQSNKHVAAGEIYTITPGGTATRITVSNGSSDPAYSPDGSRIAFISPSRTNYEITVMNADGTGRRQITSTSVAEQEPVWSPDGSRIAYASSSFDVDGQTDLEIWAINADGSGRTQLTSNSLADTQPAWSPDGSKIAFERSGDIYVMDADGSNQTNITPNSPPGCSSNCYQGADSDPAWSPDGTKIAYVHGYGPPENPFAAGGLPNIWTMDPDGSNKTNLSNTNSRSDTEPAWSPDGTQIAMVGATDTNRDIWVMNSNGSSPTPIADLKHDINPDWQPDPPTCDLSGTNGDNVLTGDPAEDEVICGLGGNDTMTGQDGDILMGGDGNDTLVAASGRATLNAGPGKDTASFAGSTTSIEAFLITGFARRVGTDPLEGVALVGIENLTGSDLDDVLTGSNGANKLVGGTGADELLGLGGKDRINSRDGAKNDTVNGGKGTDTCTTDPKEVSIKSCE